MTICGPSVSGLGQSIQFTRSRPYKKDDHAHIEQKNWTHVRKLVGWDRYESSEARAGPQRPLCGPCGCFRICFSRR